MSSLYAIKDIVTILCVLEGCDPQAVNGDAVGILQIRPICVDQANKLSGSEKYTLEDRFDVQKSKEICTLILSWQLDQHSRRVRAMPRPQKLAAAWYYGSVDKVPRKKCGYQSKFLRLHDSHKSNGFKDLELLVEKATKDSTYVLDTEGLTATEHE